MYAHCVKRVKYKKHKEESFRTFSWFCYMDKSTVKIMIYNLLAFFLYKYVFEHNQNILCKVLYIDSFF
jgi:hypothetical protein